MKAKGAVFREIGTPLAIEDVDVADPEPNEVLIRTKACGVCHSDLHFVNGVIPGPSPTIPGHEPAGIVEAVGETVRTVAVGDHIIACTSIFCGQCVQCLEGRPYWRAIGLYPQLVELRRPVQDQIQVGEYDGLGLEHDEAVPVW